MATVNEARKPRRDTAPAILAAVSAIGTFPETSWRQKNAA